MALEFFNKKNLRGVTYAGPKVRFNKMGRITFNSTGMELAGIQIGDRVEFAFDAELKQWYLVTKAREAAFILRKDKNGVSVYSKAFVREFFEKYKIDKASVSFPLGKHNILHDGKLLFPILHSIS